MDVTLRELVGVIGGELSGDGSVVIKAVAGIREAGPGTVTFLANPRYEAFLKTTRASAIIVPRGTSHPTKPLVFADNPYLTFIKAVEFFVPNRNVQVPGIHPTAIIARTARIGSGVHIGPNVVIEDQTTICDGTSVLAGTYIGRGTEIGTGCLIYPNVTIREQITIGSRVIIHSGAVIGSDGFGFVRDGDVYRKVPQIGNVVIQDDVEVGANVTIDRATTGTTLIGKGTKIDNLVQIGHNVVVGDNCILVAQVGIGGSAQLGTGVTMAGQAGAAGHITIGDGATVGAQGGATKSIQAGMTVSGYPAREHTQANKIYASLLKLPDLLKKVAELGERLSKVEERTKD
ncbi:MAG TPA: UDP-3-O-(3-hydroxymyristoyl)glucosamine N-acyltransferase [bacterium]|nr:UDP-3-O-(3-hydroxymyristoyl)glucosamine N-acyltransferase [bacterium]